MTVKILYGTKKGLPDYMAEVITDKSDRIEAAKVWATNNGFDRLTVKDCDISVKPDFINTISK